MKAIAASRFLAPLIKPKDVVSVAMPSAGEEVWRYSRIGELDLDAFSPGHAATTVDAPDDVMVVLGADLGDRLDDDPAVDLFHELNRAFMDAVLVSVPKGRVVSRPIAASMPAICGRSGKRAGASGLILESDFMRSALSDATCDVALRQAQGDAISCERGDYGVAPVSSGGAAGCWAG